MKTIGSTLVLALALGVSGCILLLDTEKLHSDSGGAAGADALAASWAQAHGVPLTELRPDYAAHGPTAATHVRNAEIVKRAHLVLVVWDGKSKGTLSTLKAARRLGRPVELLPLD